jgi:GNAT superfamily N-acetyltransferase
MITLHIEPLRTTDIPAIAGLQPPEWTDITPYFRFYTNSSFCNPVKVIHENHIVGTGVSVSFTNTAWLAHIIVDPAFRNQGIGGAIVDHLLNDLDAQSVDTVSLIATKIGEPVYLKRGFTDVCEYLFMQRQEPLAELPIPDCIRPYHPEFYDDIVNLDIFISGEDRKSLVAGHLSNALLYIDHGRLDGFYLPELGEGLVIADTRQAGLELLKVRCAHSAKVVLPAANSDAIRILNELGFNETARARRMVSGPAIAWRPGKIYARIGGNLG